MHWSLDKYSKGENGSQLRALHFWLTIFVFLVNVFFFGMCEGLNMFLYEYVFMYLGVFG